MYFWYEADLGHYVMRMRQDGDRMIVDGDGKETRVNQILQEAHVAPSLKSYYPVLLYRGEIVWVPGIRTAYSAMVDVDRFAKSDVKRCMKVQMDEGTFE